MFNKLSLSLIYRPRRSEGQCYKEPMSSVGELSRPASEFPSLYIPLQLIERGHLQSIYCLLENYR